jgi:predicted phosphodiesterase
MPVLARYDDLLHVNPGTVTYPLAPEEPLQRRTCAVWEDGEVTHFDIESGETLQI